MLVNIAKQLKVMSNVSHVRITGNRLTFRFDGNRPIHVFKSRRYKNLYIVEDKGLYQGYIKEGDLSIKTILKEVIK